MSEDFSKNFEELPNVLYDNQGIRIEQLIVGYYNETGNACGSVTLVDLGSYKILVDCALPSTDFKKDCSSHFDPNDVNCVIVTHYHSDHLGRLCDFPKAHRILPDTINNEFHGLDFKNKPYYLQLMKLSGHSNVDLALIIYPNSQSDELIVIAGDLFENANDYFSETPAVPGIDNEKLLKSRQKIRNLDPTILIPGHGPTFRLRPTTPINDERHFGQVTMRLLLTPNLFNDPVWLLTANQRQILINTREDGLPNKLMKGNSKLQAIVILKPSIRSSCALGLFDAETIYMSEDILQSPNTYSTLNEFEWIVDGLVRVCKDSEPMTLKVEIFDPQTTKVLYTIAS